MQVQKLIAMTGLLLGSLHCAGQDIQWASKVINFSTEYTDASFPKQYNAIQALGAPNICSTFGASPAAWCPSVEDGAQNDFIQVGFEKPMNIQQVIVHENLGAGSITVIDLFDTGGQSYRVYENSTPAAASTPGRIFSFTCDRTPYLVASVRVVLSTSAVPGFNHIDAIGIADHKHPYEVKINLPPDLQKGFVRENLGDKVNSVADDLSPVISVDGKTLYYTRQGHPNNVPPIDNQDIWVADILPDRSFAESRNIGAPLNTSENSSALTALPDNNSLLLLNVYKPDGSMEKGVSLVKRSATGWGAPEQLVIDKYYNDNIYGEYNLAPSGEVLVATMQRKDSYGSKDLYVCFRKPDGTWTEPLNMGPVLNTSASESSPFVAADGVTMYFSSPAHPGYGSNDMFFTRRLDDTWTNWSEPQNLGNEVNTEKWDAYYTVPASGDYAYFVSYLNTLGKADIFRIKLPDAIKPKPVMLVSGRTIDKKTGLPIGANITYENLETGQELGRAVSDPKDGSYSIVLPAGANYGFMGTARNYAPVSQNLNLPVVEKYTEVQQDLYLVPIEVGAVIRLNNIFFDTDKSELKKASVPELSRVVQMMKDYPALKIEIGGHTDSDASDVYNLDLSKKRSTAVYNYLIKAGVAADRLSSKGYGEVKPLVPNTTPENKAINRRVEFTVLGM